jgi:hypothetical protein
VGAVVGEAVEAVNAAHDESYPASCVAGLVLVPSL